MIAVLTFASGSPTIGPNTRWYFLTKYMMAFDSKMSFDVLGSRDFHKYHIPHNEVPKNEVVNCVRFVRWRTFSGRSRLSQLLGFVIFCIRSTFWLVSKGRRYHTIVASSPNIFVVIPAVIHKKIFGSRLVFEIRDLWPEVIKDISRDKRVFARALFGLMYSIERLAVYHSDIVCSVKEGDFLYLAERYGLPRSRFRFVPNGMERPPVVKNKARESKKLIIGYAGSFGDYYDLRPLIEAVALSTRRDLEVRLIGSGPQKNELFDLVCQRGLDNVLFFDPVPKVELTDFLLSIDYGFVSLKRLSTNRYGISCNKIFDYLSLGIPVISYNDCAYDPVPMTKSGVKVSDYHALSLASEIDRLPVRGELEYRAYSSNALTCFQSLYDMEILAKKYREFL